MKLQTLKDLSDTTIECETGCFDDSKYPYVYLKDLKQEAIKWIKELTEQGILGNLDSQDRHYENMGRKAKIEWIKHFFNITEEDLE